jgi:hypothetical protein
MTTTETGAGKRHGWRVAAIAVCLGAVLATGGCSNADSEDPEQLTPAQADEAQALVQEYDRAVRDKDWPLAAKTADRLRKKYPASEAAAKVRETLGDVQKHVDDAAAANALASLWNYQANPAGEGTQYTAMANSHVDTDDNGNYLAEPDARLVLRVHPEWGHSAYLLLAQKQFTCGEPCTLQIAFDDGPQEPWDGKQADSGQGPALFIEDHARFYAAMRAAQVVRIHLPKTEGSIAPTLRFDVGGYDAARLKTEF